MRGTASDSIKVLSLILGWTLVVVSTGYFMSRVSSLFLPAIGAAIGGSPSSLILFALPLGIAGVFYGQWSLTRGGSWCLALLNGVLVALIALTASLFGA